MTTKPKAKKFRIRRGGTADSPVQSGEAPQPAAQPTPQAKRPVAPAEPVQNVLRAKPSPEQPQQAVNPAARQAAPQVAPRQTKPRPQAAAQTGAAAPQPVQPQQARPARPEQGAREYAQQMRQQPAQPPQPQQPAGQRPRRQPAAEAGAPQNPAAAQATPPREAPAQEGMVSSAQEVTADQEIDAIRREGLTGRQLRMARRVAQKHGLAPTSDFDAVRLLRASGIEPFKRTSPLELAVPSIVKNPREDDVQLPQTVAPEGSNLPSAEMAPADRRMQEIGEIQRDIARRRRRKMVLLGTRLGFFVFLPTLLVAWYFAVLASPLYATKSEFLVLQADAAGGGSGGIGGLLAGTQFATNQDAIAVQKFLISRPAMIRLDEDHAFKAHFSQEALDPIKRLPEDATNEDAYKLYKRYVKIGYDPTEGVIHMEVIAADPQISVEFSNALISYAEEKVDELSLRKRDDQMREARATLAEAKQERENAQRQLVELQEGTLLDPQGEIASIRALINNVEVQLQDKELQLSAQLNNPRPNRPKVQALETEIRLLREELGRQQSRLNEAGNGDSSLAAKAAQIQMAQADLATADLFLQSALQNEKQTAQAAARQVRYLTTAVSPIAPDAPSYPRVFENSILAFLVLSGAYLMISLTASILREQVST
jgi:capsular polysaccharide transport system permease protein